MSKVVISNGIVLSARYGTTKHSKVDMYRVSVRYTDEAMEELIEVGKEFFKEAGKKMTPSFLKKREVIEDTGVECIYLNYHSKYEIPVKGNSVNEVTDILPGARVKVATVFKEGAFYPRAILVLENGEEINPFEGME